MLFCKGRLTLSIDFSSWLSQAADPEVIRLVPLDSSVAIALNELPGNFHGDPADRIIVATARAHSLTLMTEDKGIRRSKSVKIF